METKVHSIYVGTNHTSAEVRMTIDFADGKYLDTRIDLHGTPCWVSGENRMEFVIELQALVDKYAI
jgi:hypothetical protein